MIDKWNLLIQSFCLSDIHFCMRLCGTEFIAFHVNSTEPVTSFHRREGIHRTRYVFSWLYAPSARQFAHVLRRCWFGPLFLSAIVDDRFARSCPVSRFVCERSLMDVCVWAIVTTNCLAIAPIATEDRLLQCSSHFTPTRYSDSG